MSAAPHAPPSEPGDASGEPPSNPFATRYIRPGAIPYLFLPDESAASVVDRLAAAGWRGQIIGSHGAGKSTLLATLEPEITARGKRVLHVTLHDGQRSLGEQAHVLRGLSANSVLVVDGYEQLSRWSRWRLGRRVKGAKAGLLVTAHADQGWPTVYEVRPDLATLRRVVEGLLERSLWRITPEALEAMFAAQGENTRETLFALYDAYESRRGRPTGLD